MVIVGAVGFIIGITAVVGMSVTMHLFYGYPILPVNPVDWQEDVEYALSMALATVAGFSLASITHYTATSSDTVARDNQLIKWVAVSIAGRGSGKMFTEQIDAIERIIRVLTMIFAAIGSVYIGLRAIVP
jgi:hypothetical protein